MPTLYNQTKQALSWDMGQRVYTCDPWGSVDVPERLIAACKSYGLPLGSVPVAPEIRAQVRVADQSVDADRAAFKALRDEVEAAKASEKAAKNEVDKLNMQLQKRGEEVVELRKRCAMLEADLNTAVADKNAAENLLNESARTATASEERAIKAEALLAAKSEAPKSADSSQQKQHQKR